MRFQRTDFGGRRICFYKKYAVDRGGKREAVMVNFYTVKEVAAYLGVSEKWVYRHREVVPGFFRLGSLILFDKLLLEEELKKRAKKSGK